MICHDSIYYSPLEERASTIPILVLQSSRLCVPPEGLPLVTQVIQGSMRPAKRMHGKRLTIAGAQLALARSIPVTFPGSPRAEMQVNPRPKEGPQLHLPRPQAQGGADNQPQKRAGEDGRLSPAAVAGAAG